MNTFQKNKTKPTKHVKPTNNTARPAARPKKKSSLNPNLLIQKASPVIEKTVQQTCTFESFSLDHKLLTNIKAQGYTYATEIQEKSFEPISNNENIIGIANTGTGKTAAFLIPLIQKLIVQEQDKSKTLVIVPTRELALQVMDEFKKLSNGLNLKAICLIGGTSVEKDIQLLKKPVDLIVGTPGRLLDLKNKRSLPLAQFEWLILDEFDKMLDMGFIKDIRTIVSYMSNRKQTLLFSATKDPKQQHIIGELVKNPTVITIHSGEESSKTIDQDVIHVPANTEKYDLFLDLVKSNDFDKIIVFTETKHLANRLSKKLNQSGVSSDQIHGNKSQNYRINALDKFKTGKIKVLVATDVAARGIDVDDVSLVVNYQLPMDYDTYIHRVGRTGRAGKMGKALTFVD